MNLKQIKRFLFSFLLLTVLSGFSFAQKPVPWFWGEQTLWKTLTKESFSVPVSPTILQASLRISTAKYEVISTPKNWMYHRFSHSGLLNDAEKERLLKADFTSAPNILGKLEVLHDRDADLFSFLQYQFVPLNTQAYTKRSELFKNAYAELENFYLPSLVSRFSHLFPKEQVKLLLLDPSQPSIFILNKGEIDKFPTLSLEEQKAYAQSIIQTLTPKMQKILKTPVELLPEEEFQNYYFQKLRLKYFSLLLQALEKATAPRKTIIIRVRKTPGISFLKEGQTFMTDAQRLGFLHFYHDKFQTSLSGGTAPDRELLEIKTVLAQQEKLYNHFAVAEAFNLPYETVFARGTSWSPLYIPNGTKWEEYISTTDISLQVKPLIADIRNQLLVMLAQEPTDLNFYARYFRLKHQLSVYETLLIRNRLFLRNY